MPKFYKGPDNHTSAFMVPRFLRKRTAPATITAVEAAMPHLRGTKQLIGLAAYVWYQRSNHSKKRYAGWTNPEECAHAYDYYEAFGVFPVSAARLASIKPSTIARYTELVYA